MEFQGGRLKDKMKAKAATATPKTHVIETEQKFRSFKRSEHIWSLSVFAGVTTTVRFCYPRSKVPKTLSALSPQTKAGTALLGKHLRPLG